MMFPLAAALRHHTVTALAAAGAPERFWLCRDCDHRWRDIAGVCIFCDRHAIPDTGDLFAPIHKHGDNIGIAHTRFETLGL